MLIFLLMWFATVLIVLLYLFFRTLIKWLRHNRNNWGMLFQNIVWAMMYVWLFSRLNAREEIFYSTPIILLYGVAFWIYIIYINHTKYKNLKSTI
jgi:hypothetical protein